jgi:hypothetical protein
MSPASAQADVEIERRQGRLVGALALLAVAVEFAAIVIALSAIQSGPGGRATRGGREASQYLDFDKHRDVALLAASLKAVGFLLVIPVGLYVFRALKARTPSTPSYILWLGVISPILVGITAILNYSSLAHVVTEFINSGTLSNQHAKDLADHDSFFRAAGVAGVLAGVVVAAWLGALCAAAIATGLLPKFLAYYGYGAAVALVLAPEAGLALLIGWLGSVALIALNRFPGGRPLAWETGRAEPLP